MNSKPEKAADQIRNQIYAGVYGIGERLPSERKLADSFNCTQFSISKAISILEEEGLVVKKRGSGNYIKNNKSTVTVAFLTSERNNTINPVWHNVYDALNVMTASSNIHYNLCVIAQQSDEIPYFKLDSADIVIVALGLRESIIEKILSLEKPVIWLEEYNRDLPGKTVSFDNFKAGSIAAEHLFSQGCRNFAYIQYDSFIYPSQRRFEGFQQTLQKQNKYFNLISYTWFGAEHEAMKRLQDLLRKENEINGVFCFSDFLVPWVIRAAYAMGRQIPGELTVMGVDGSELSRLFLPTFSTIDQSVDQIARKTYEAMKKIINGEACTSKDFIEPELIERDSTVQRNIIQREIDIPQIAVHV